MIPIEPYDMKFWRDEEGHCHYQIGQTHIQVSKHFRHDLNWARGRVEKTRMAFELYRQKKGKGDD
jgi:hypothetical protein